ncbi:TPA: hypothetical protein DCP77_03510 [Candidatus Collierbacteria bacterium]|nr:MAG: hypothetical protein UV29_C0017G0002 [Candidatus Collierbacteria bacterium GW2011_GWD2_42_50]KKS64790.1 MAG: hypothetical protein UV32_C0006G0002 [Candidatus Collierbacteria bacterium GW2011_GWF2_42_51]HAI22758.1 hypothetical protein [Candidatus Collierbacteria bacterium]HAN22817.1 hypothetical protein [Candidatus Collierbacteria bacterium]HAS68882.1 hypothetical protein [Candidatus Collierbacteria bacterium]
MLSIAHGATGAFIASKIPNPLISIPLVLLSHYIEDRIPHWDVGQGLTAKKKSRKAAFLQELFFDFPLSIIIVYFIFQAGHPFDWRVWMGWFVGLTPDFLEFPYLFMDARFFPIKQLAAFHGLVHRSTPHKLWGLLPQLLVILLVILLK